MDQVSRIITSLIQIILTEKTEETKDVDSFVSLDADEEVPLHVDTAHVHLCVQTNPEDYTPLFIVELEHLESGDLRIEPNSALFKDTFTEVIFESLKVRAVSFSSQSFR